MKMIDVMVRPTFSWRSKRNTKKFRNVLAGLLQADYHVIETNEALIVSNRNGDTFEVSINKIR